MDHLTEYELVDILNNLQFTDMNSWEQTRLQIYTVCQVMSKNKLNPKDLITFPWDININNLKHQSLPTTITTEEVEMLRKKAKLLENQIN